MADLFRAVFREDSRRVFLCEIADDVDPVVGLDSYRLRQVLINLLGNAVKFTADGSVVLKTSRSDHHEHGLSISVEDTGIGIPPGKLGELFTPFGQVSLSTSRKYGGAGLGLSIAQQLVSLMGGEIRIFSREGEGSKFWFEIPAPPCSLLDSASGASAEAEYLSGKKVLIIDARRVRAGMVQRWLKKMPVKCTVVSDASEVEAALAGAPYDLLSLHLPLEASGIEVLRQLRGPNNNSEVPLVCFGTPGAEMAQQGLVFDHVQESLVLDTDLFEGWMAGLGHAADSGAGPSRAPIGASNNLGDILVVEDNSFNMAVISAMLDNLGYGIVEAEDGVQALARATGEGRQYSLILMDCEMPNMDGYEATRRLRSQGVTTPILAVTAHVLEEQRMLCLEAGMNDIITKPIIFDALRDKLAEWIDSKAGD